MESYDHFEMISKLEDQFNGNLSTAISNPTPMNSNSIAMHAAIATANQIANERPIQVNCIEIEDFTEVASDESVEFKTETNDGGNNNDSSSNSQAAYIEIDDSDDEDVEVTMKMETIETDSNTSEEIDQGNDTSEAIGLIESSNEDDDEVISDEIDIKFEEDLESSETLDENSLLVPLRVRRESIANASLINYLDPKTLEAESVTHSIAEVKPERSNSTLNDKENRPIKRTVGMNINQSNFNDTSIDSMSSSSRNKKNLCNENDCNFTTIHNSRMNDHKECQHDDKRIRFFCKFCKTSFQTKSNFTKHIKSQQLKYHRNATYYTKMVACLKEPNRKYKCEFDACKFSTDYQRNYRRHMDAHNKPQHFICDTCNKRFSSKWNLKKHFQRCQKN